ncbi:MAG: hypothetical protein KAW12_20750 [Candidatus Aminicenantes bacterium]|nr:hypothetical protein [Candidatus Aminicenantes bacterium]
MEHTYVELKKKNIDELREIAAGIEHEAVQGYTELNKEPLLEAVCKALGLDMREHHEVVGVDKSPIKAQIKSWKKRRDEALTARKRTELKTALRMIHRLKRQLHKATV